MDEQPSTLSIIPFDTDLSEYTPPSSKPISIDAVVNCQLMFERGGAFFEFAMSPKSLPVGIGRMKDSTENSKTINLSSFDAYDSGVSRAHARLERAGKRLFIRDLNSTNGTRINGKRVVPMNVHEIHHGDRIEFGRLSALFYVK
jgi:hypothetical protein